MPNIDTIPHFFFVTDRDGGFQWINLLTIQRITPTSGEAPNDGLRIFFEPGEEDDRAIDVLKPEEVRKLALLLDRGREKIQPAH